MSRNQPEQEMGRIGITYEQVAAEAEAMKAEKMNPTARAIRERLGTGSMSTITVHLAQWRGDQDEETVYGLTPEAQNAIGREIDKMVKERTQEIEEQLKEHEKDLLTMAKEAEITIKHLNEELQAQKIMTIKAQEEAVKSSSMAAADLRIKDNKILGLEIQISELKAKLTENTKRKPSPKVKQQTIVFPKEGLE